MRAVTLIASSEGGVDLEELAKTEPEKIFRKDIDPIVGLHPFEAREAGYSIGMSDKSVNDFATICTKIFEIFNSVDADLAESNPLAIRTDGSLVALDSRITLDDNALFRHKEYDQVDDELSPLEREAHENDLAFVPTRWGHRNCRKRSRSSYGNNRCRCLLWWETTLTFLTWEGVRVLIASTAL